MMRHVAGACMAAVMLLAPLVGFSQPGTADLPAVLPGAALSPAPDRTSNPPECWVEHAQVQPAPNTRRIAVKNDAFADPKIWSDDTYRLGTEHVNLAQMQRACREYWRRRP